MSQNQHIIIVDDEAPAREMVGDYLKMHGFTVTLCDGGKSLRAAIETGSPPDLVVLDLNMPEEDGLSIIRVTDEGAGLSPEDLGRLFGRFQRLSAKPTAGESSTGLGLSIVKRIIDMHGGKVTADSAGPGQGSTFAILLPATPVS